MSHLQGGPLRLQTTMDPWAMNGLQQPDPKALRCGKYIDQMGPIFPSMEDRQHVGPVVFFWLNEQ